ncbi:uncharacterized protein JN550_009025 [Neoarthrinium moseri]|uniref:uncharacterized protein n=1 Tax=Neoarthrinium moseri TaxID=1658444 RepID=UPI001FDC53F5|nr:uncharacterized protein JN550_009025 [Neoarthrinium moseri]KAI1864468.1 hypothetical protein JN550_009025 [Neoarthrinium moseri]
MEKLNKMAAELDEEITRDLVNVLVKAKKLDEIWGGAHQQYQNALDTVARELGQTTASYSLTVRAFLVSTSRSEIRSVRTSEERDLSPTQPVERGGDYA